MKIKNIKMTSDKPCSCGSWLKHWEKFSALSFAYCSVSSPNCMNKDLVGAYVRKVDSDDKKWYIVPLCSAHSKDAGILEISDNITLIPANKSKTCESPLLRFLKPQFPQTPQP